MRGNLCSKLRLHTQKSKRSKAPIVPPSRSAVGDSLWGQGGFQAYAMPLCLSPFRTRTSADLREAGKRGRAEPRSGCYTLRPAAGRKPRGSALLSCKTKPFVCVSLCARACVSARSLFLSVKTVEEEGWGSVSLACALWFPVCLRTSPFSLQPFLRPFRVPRREESGLDLSGQR